MRKTITTSLLLLLTSSALWSQTLDKANETWNEGKQNQVENVRYDSNNPVFLSYNKVKTYCVALVDYAHAEGTFRNVNQAKKNNDLGVYIGGLKNVGKFDLSGYIKYDYIGTKDARWNATAHLNPYNPFILADSVYSDQTIETFDMNAKGSYIINDKWRAGLSIGYKSGRLSDQTDPRPETNYSDFPVRLGAEYALNNKWHLGVVAGVRLFREDISYTLVNPLDPYSYFLMKGNGDYYRRSTGEVTGYQREYKGTDYMGGLQAVWDICPEMTDHLEVNFTHGTENATDEGSTPYKGGDYAFNHVDLANRFLMKQNSWLHNIVLGGSLDMGDGNWYDQKKSVDADHGNLTYYQILSKYKVHSQMNLSAMLEYRLDKLTDEGEQDWFADVCLGAQNVERKQYDDDITKQKGTLMSVHLSWGKNFQWDKVGLNAIIRGGYTMPSSTSFEDGSSYANQNIIKAYSLPAYQYQFAKRMDLGATVDVHMPLKGSMILGVIAKVDYQYCPGMAEDYMSYAVDYKSTHRTMLNCGIYMKF